jgi:hypothetical protein
MDNIYLNPTRVKNFSPTQVKPSEATKACHILKVMTDLIFSEDITVGKLRFATHALLSNLAVDSYSNREIADIVGKSERTARSIRTWADNIDAFDRPCEKKIAACSVLLSKLNTNSTNTNSKHEENVFSKEMELALTLLHAIGFNSFGGEVTVPRRSARTVAWIDRWGLENVLHAVWIAEGPRGATRNKAGFVRTLVESGVQAKEGWQHPKLVCTADKVVPDAMEKVAAAPTLPTLPTLPSLPTLPTLPSLPTLPTLPSLPAPVSGHMHELVTSALQNSTRAGAYQRWFKDLRFADVHGDLICWCPSPVHHAAMVGPYRRILDGVLRKHGLVIAEFRVGSETVDEFQAVAEPLVHDITDAPKPEINETHQIIVSALRRGIRPAAFNGWLEILRFTEQNGRTMCWCPSRSHLVAILAGRLGADLRHVLADLGITEFGFCAGDSDQEGGSRLLTFENTF